MFDEMPDQFYQFLAATNNNNTNTTTTCNNNSNNNNVTNNIANFDDTYFIHQPQLPLLHHPSVNEVKGETVTSCVVLPWSNEEVLALVKIRSSLDSSWFSVDDFTWETVSRKLAEIGFKRSAQHCKEKFEQETKSFNNNNNIIVNKNNNNIISQNYRLFGELEELYNCNDDHSNLNNHINDHDNKGNETDARDDGIDEEDNDEQQCMDDRMNNNVGKKRKREKKFKLFKGFCEKIVNKMIVQQEEFHCKIIEQMAKRDEENIVREIDWKKQEIDMINKELEVRAHEKAIVGDRQAKIFGFLKNFSSSNNFESDQFVGDLLGDVEIKVPNNTISLSKSSSILSQNSISNLVTQQKCDLPTSLSKKELGYGSANLIENSKLVLPMSSSLDQPSKNPNDQQVTIACQSDLSRITSISNTDKATESYHTSTDAAGQHESVKDDIGRRWPRDEVIALINIKCNVLNNNSDHNEKESISKGPLWERISQKMMELGYKRSSKRCKEKWENINKYFKKTKDLNKKRSIDSRTCPYFHQLSHYYNQGTPQHHQSDRLVNVGSTDSSAMALSGDPQGGSST